jgi:hypothetical protein
VYDSTVAGRVFLQPLRSTQVYDHSFTSFVPPLKLACSHPAVPILIEASERFRDKLEFFSSEAGAGLLHMPFLHVTQLMHLKLITLLQWQRHEVRPSLRIMLTMSPGLVRKQVSANICLCAPHCKQRVTSPVTRSLPQVGKQGMEEYTYELSRFEDFLSAKLAPVRHSNAHILGA